MNYREKLNFSLIFNVGIPEMVKHFLESTSQQRKEPESEPANKVLCYFMLFKLAELCLFRELNRRQRITTINTRSRILGRKRVTRSQFMDSQNYMLDRLRADDLRLGYSALLHMIFLYYHVCHILWTASGKMCSGELCKSVIFFLALNTLHTLVYYPINYLALFTIETEHGFNRQTSEEFNMTVLANYLLETLVCVPEVVMGQMLRRWDNAPLGGAGLYVLFARLIPAAIADDAPPTSYRLIVDFPPGHLKESVEQLAQRLGVPFDKIYIVKASELTGHMYAFCAGYCYWQRRILLFDNLLEGVRVPRDSLEADEERERHIRFDESAVVNTTPVQRDSEEERRTVPDPPVQRMSRLTEANVLAIIAHEMAHYKLKHVAKLFLLETGYQFVKYFCYLSLCQSDIVYEMFGFAKERPAVVGYVGIVLILLQPLDNVGRIAIRATSRSFEKTADEFVVNAGLSGALANCLEKMVVNDLQFPVYDPAYEAITCYHPSILKRIKKLRWNR